jgi:Thiol:disulfide interchange protein DsbD, N-terminal
METLKSSKFKAGRTGTALLGLLAALIVAGAGSKEMVPLRRVDLLPEKEGVAPGSTLALALRATLNREFHVNSHVPTQDYLIPTAIQGEAGSDAQLGEWIYPEGEMKTFPFSDEPLRVYEGTFLIHGSVKMAPDAALGPRHVLLHLRYQACTREKCLPPRTEEVPLDFKVVAAGTAVRSLHPDLFPPPRP